MSELGVLQIAGTSVVLRRAVETDVAAIVDLLADDEIGATRENDTSDLAPYLAAFPTIDADAAHLLAIAVHDTQVVATMQLTFLPSMARRGALRAQIEAVRVHRDYRGRGLGAAMFDWAISESRVRGCVLVQLTTDKARSDAHRFYARLGFAASHEGLKLQL